MKNLLLTLVLFTSLLTFSQPPVSADSIYWTPKYCSTAETIEDCTNSWIWSGNFNDCIQPSELFCETLFPDMWITDSYECCCQVASLPGSESAWNGFFGSNCQTYLDSVGFIYNDPDYVNWTSLDENQIKFEGMYIDMFGRQHITQPNGFSIFNGNKYIKLGEI